MPLPTASRLLLTIGAAFLAACSGMAPRGGMADIPGEPIFPFAPIADAVEPGLQLQRHGQLDEASVARIEDPVQRGAMRMAQGLVNENRRRMARGFGELRLDSWSLRECDHDRTLRDDERRAEARFDHLSAIGPAMLRGPLRDALRELPFARDAQLSVEEFCQSHDLFQADRSAREPGRDRGRLAVRVRATDPGEGLELGYRIGGLHALSSAARARVRLDLPLAERTTARVAVAHHYAAARADFRLEIGWQLDADTRVHVAMGNRIGPLPTPGYWPGADPMDETGTGVSLYVERLF